jgi:hypothetical protein
VFLHQRSFLSPTAGRQTAKKIVNLHNLMDRLENKWQRQRAEKAKSASSEGERDQYQFKCV